MMIKIVGRMEVLKFISGKYLHTKTCVRR